MMQEESWEETWSYKTLTGVGGGLVEDDDFGLEGGDGQTVAFTGRLSSVDEGLIGGGGVGDETQVVDVEKNGDEGPDVRVRTRVRWW